MMKQIQVVTLVVSLCLLLGLQDTKANGDTAVAEKSVTEGSVTEGQDTKAEDVAVDTPKTKTETVEQDAGPDSIVLDLQKAEAERRELLARMGTVTQVSDELQKRLRAQLQEQVKSLTKSRDTLQVQIDQLAESHGRLQGQIAELIRSHNTAAAEARAAEQQRDKLRSELAAESKRASELRDHLAQIFDLASLLGFTSNTRDYDGWASYEKRREMLRKIFREE